MSPATVTMLMNDVGALKADQQKLAERFGELSETLGKAIGDHQLTVLAMFGEIIRRFDALGCQQKPERRPRCRPNRKAKK